MWRWRVAAYLITSPCLKSFTTPLFSVAGLCNLRFKALCFHPGRCAASLCSHPFSVHLLFIQVSLTEIPVHPVLSFSLPLALPVLSSSPANSYSSMIQHLFSSHKPSLSHSWLGEQKPWLCSHNPCSPLLMAVTLALGCVLIPHQFQHLGVPGPELITFYFHWV